MVEAAVVVVVVDAVTVEVVVAGVHEGVTKVELEELELVEELVDEMEVDEEIVDELLEVEVVVDEDVLEDETEDDDVEVLVDTGVGIL